MHYSLTDMQADFEINRPVRYQINAKKNYFHRRSRTARRTDGRTDGQTSRMTTIGSFFRKKKKTTNKSINSDTHFLITYSCISIFSNIGLVHLSKPYTQIYVQKVVICINLQLPIVILKKNMHHCI